MSNMNEFKGKTEEAITTVKQDVAEVKRKVEAIDKKIWLILLVVAVLLLKDQTIATNLLGHVLAFGK